MSAPVQITIRAEGDDTFSVGLPFCGFFRKWSRLSEAQALDVAADFEAHIKAAGDKPVIVRTSAEAR